MSHEPAAALTPVGRDATALHIPEAMRREIIEHLRACLPQEGVGLLSVKRGGRELRVDRFYAGRNADASPTRYTMDPGDVVAAMGDMGRRGATLGAIVHSHPCTPPVPSVGDFAEATMPHVLLVIVSFRPEIAVRSWRLVTDEMGMAVSAREIPVTG